MEQLARMSQSSLGGQLSAQLGGKVRKAGVEMERIGRGMIPRVERGAPIRDRPERGEEQEILQGESGGLSSPPPHQDDSTRDFAEAKNDFWSITGEIIYRHYVEPRVKLYMPREENISYSDEVHRLYQKYLYITGRNVGKTN